MGRDSLFERVIIVSKPANIVTATPPERRRFRIGGLLLWSVEDNPEREVFRNVLEAVNVMRCAKAEIARPDGRALSIIDPVEALPRRDEVELVAFVRRL